MSASALLILNRASGTGYPAQIVDQLARALQSGHDSPLNVDAVVVDDHPAARKATVNHASAAARPSLVVAAGGGGTLRAVVEGVMESFPAGPPGPDVVRLAALRMGSGNVVARNLGIPLDPLEAARQIGANMARNMTKPCSVLRCSHGLPGGATAVRYAVTMCGLGQWGLVPGDIVRWRESHAAGRKRAASWIGLERINALEYVAFGAARMLAGTVSASRCEMVEIDGAPRMRLLAAVALNLPLPPLPNPGVSMGEEAAGLTVVPRLGRPFRRRLGPGDSFALRLLDRDTTEFFLDEDPERATGWLKLDVAGVLAFVPGQAA
ncbi:MAG TPA: diacylglycerol kinase family protein [Candidatus Dormibacteraeota bacterium]|nr:diacylglycerol kinase family protein [Candidatus Dormibacteraeota bacterium]